MNLSDILGNGRDRPPAPEVASAEDVERYNLEWINRHGGSNPFDSTNGESSAIAAEAVRKQLGENIQHKAEFPWLFDPQRGVRWDFDPIALRNLAQGNTWVGMLTQSITKEISETPWTITRTDGDRAETRKQDRLSTHPEKRTPLEKADGMLSELPDATAERIAELLRNPTPDHNWHDAVEMWMADLLEVGSATGTKAFPRTAYDGEGTDAQLTRDAETIRPRAIQPSPPEVWTKGYHGKTGVLDSFYQFDREKAPGSGNVDGGTTGTRGFRTPIQFSESEVMWTDMTPRTNRRYGLPPTLLVNDFLQSLDLAISQEQQYLAKGSLPSGAVVFEEWDREQVIEWKEENAENIKGKPWKLLTLAGQGGNVGFEPFSYNFEEMQFTERMQWYARVVSSVFQVPTAVVGIEPERINYHTFQGERENFEENTLGPYLQKLERYINGELIEPHWGRDYHFEFKPGVSESTRGIISERVRAEWNANLITREQALGDLGREMPDDAENGYKADVVDDPDPQDVGGDPADALGLSARLGKGDPTAANHQVDPGTGVGICENTDQEFDAETFGDIARDCPHCGDPISHIDPEDLDGGTGKDAAGGDTGNGRGGSVTRKDEPLRETDQWYQFDVQPHMVESLQADIADDVDDLFEQVLSDDEIQATIDRLAADATDESDGSDETEKSLSALSRRLREVLSQTRIAGDIADAIREHSADAVRETLEETIEDADADTDDPDPDAVDVEAVTGRLKDRDVGFANAFADELAADIRETVGEGWAEGKNSREIASDIAEQGDIAEGWGGAERIARQELQIATGEARSAVADDLNKVEVWQASGGASGDGRNRDAHLDMHGLWKRPGENWVVDYSDRGRGVQKESVPGDSEPGIGCRCVTLLRDREEVDDSDYAGDSGLN